MPSFKTTLFLVAAIACAVAPDARFPSAVALTNHGQGPIQRRADHLDHSRKMLKMRGPAPNVKRQDDPILGGGDDDPPVSRSSSTPVPSSTPRPSSTPPSSTPPSSTPSPSSSTERSSSTTNTPASRSSTESQDSSQTRASTPTNSPSSRTRSSPTTRVVIETQTQSAPPKAQDPDNSFLPKPVLIGLVVAAASCVCAAALWTIIRKWKFGASRQFEDRLEPVEWEHSKGPNPGLADHDPSAVAVHRGNSVTSHNHGSSGDHGYNTGYGAYGQSNNMSSTNNYPATMAPDLPPALPPAHDFTAGGGAYGPNSYEMPVQRGPSPGPNNAYGGGYDAYGNGGYSGNNGYGGNGAYDAYDYNTGYPQGGNAGGVPRHQF